MKNTFVLFVMAVMLFFPFDAEYCRAQEGGPTRGTGISEEAAEGQSVVDMLNVMMQEIEALDRKNTIILNRIQKIERTVNALSTAGDTSRTIGTLQNIERQLRSLDSKVSRLF